MYEGWGEHLEGWIRGCGWPHNARTPEHDLAFAAAMRAMGRQTALAVLPELGALFAINMRDFGDTLDVGYPFTTQPLARNSSRSFSR